MGLVQGGRKEPGNAIIAEIFQARNERSQKTHLHFDLKTPSFDCKRLDCTRGFFFQKVQLGFSGENSLPGSPFSYILLRARGGAQGAEWSWTPADEQRDLRCRERSPKLTQTPEEIQGCPLKPHVRSHGI